MMLHQLVEWHISVSTDIPPTPKVWLSEPLLEGQPSKGFDHQLSLSKVSGFMDTRQVSWQGTERTKKLKKSDHCLMNLKKSSSL